VAKPVEPNPQHTETATVGETAGSRPKSATRALGRNVYAFGATSLLNDTASEMAYWILPAFLASIGAGPAKLGIIEGIAESVASFVKLFSGYIADRTPRRKPIVFAGYAVANAAKPLLAIATQWWHVLLIRFSDRFAKGMRGAPRDVMLAESTPKEKLGGAFGLMQAMDSAGAILGPLIALWLLPSLGFRGLFWIAAIPGALCLIVLAVFVRETRHERSRTELPKFSPANLPGSFYYVLVAVTLFSLGNSSDMFLVMRAQTIGIPPAHAPLLGLAFNATYTAASWPFGRLSDRSSKRVMAAAGYLVYAGTYAVFAAAPSRPAIWAMMATYGLFYALTNPVLRALVAETVAPEARGRAFGLFFFITSIAMLLASIVTGELWKHYGPQLPFYASAGLAVTAAIMLLVKRPEAMHV
jgi:MFS family permease